MAEFASVLVFEKGVSNGTLSVIEVSENNIPEKINGESGFHIYHVRMLTERLLKEYVKLDTDCNLSDDEIEKIAIASTLHDLGKLKIPVSILNSSNRLSPVEYDIVKKHSVIGEEMIINTENNINPQIIEYAKQIARLHHERYDGTGYPDGLTGDNIPLCAQIVSIADVYDALTSERNYKKTISQDVAIEMISNGMSGVFNPILIECLLKVVNNKTLMGIRERVKKSRRVVEADKFFSPKNVLFIGNTEYITKEFIDQAFFDSNVMIAGESVLKETKKLKIRKIKNFSAESLLQAYQFDLIVYLSDELTYGSEKDSDTGFLRNVLLNTKLNQKDTKFIYISSLDAAFEGKSDKAILVRAKEGVCEYYLGDKNFEIKIIRVPYLYSGAKEDDYLYCLFKGMDEGLVKIDDLSQAKVTFISVKDLGELIRRITDNWNYGVGILNVNDELGITFGDLAKKIAEIKPAKVEFTSKNPEKILKLNNAALRSAYGWFSKISILDDIQEEYERYLDKKGNQFLTLKQKLKNIIATQSKAVKITELFVLFLITEVLIYITNSALYFSIVDFRMAFIVIMATLYGLAYGLSAAGLASISWLVAKLMSGTKFLTIFYEPTNWLSFVFFFLVGALCGYIRLKNNENITFVKQENKLLEDKLIFTRQLYTDTFNEKRDLKKQIIGSKDSFGKIFDVTRNLDTVDSRELYLKIIETFEQVLENKCVSVYSLNKDMTFARLEVASRDIIANATRSVSLQTLAPIVEHLKTGEPWRNTDLIQGYPVYAQGIYKDGELKLFIFIWRAEPHQYSLYYVNLFKMLCDLAQMSLIRAYDYNLSVYEKMYIKDTRILKTDAFLKALDNFKKMKNKKISSFLLLEIHCKDKSIESVGNDLSKCIRQNDILGISPDGSLMLVLSQASEKDLEYFLPRLEDINVEISVIKEM